VHFGVNHAVSVRVNWFGYYFIAIDLGAVVGLFNRGKGANSGSPEPLQVPDQLALSAKAEYGNAHFLAAAELYGKAVDKLHTMYVVGDCKYRQPSRSDATITEGLVSAVGAALAMDSNAPVRSLIEQAVGYMDEIVRVPQARPVADMYQSSINELSRIAS
jgi:hypothetical protein